jgi:hypothetical protein
VIGAQHSHHRLVRRYGWLAVRNVFEVSHDAVPDLRYHGQQTTQENVYRRRLAALMPTPADYNGAPLPRRVYPETVRLTRLSCVLAPQLAGSGVAASSATRWAFSDRIAAALGYPASLIDADEYVVINWLQVLADTRPLEPARTYPDTRAKTLDGDPPTAAAELQAEVDRLRTARREFHKDHCGFRHGAHTTANFSDQRHRGHTDALRIVIPSS